jgi:hypothetical protein
MFTNWQTFRTVVAWMWRLVTMVMSYEVLVDVSTEVEADDSNPLATMTFLSTLVAASLRSYWAACT